MMILARQRTLRNPIHCSGVGLHSGAHVSMTLHPAPANSGIRFLRVDLPGAPEAVEASWRNARETPLCTTLLGEGGAKIGTVEHLMSAFAGCAIDNVTVELDGGEVPAMDGSAAPFVYLMRGAGIVEQQASRRAVKILKPVSIRDGDRAVALAPGENLSVHFEIDFANPLIGRQACSVVVDPESYERDIARARTFGFLDEVADLRAKGLARGGSLDNAIVISGDKIINEDGLRFEDEFVRHKVLDAIGDLYLVGGPLVGRFHGLRAGHALNLRLLQALFANDSAWCWHEPEAAPRSGAAVPPARAVAAPA
jgi:UDP-3-O-[3-hydroxymyristoyl] N-acetylglucosamine deacetylase